MQDVTTCPNCGAARAAGARFCASCGLDFNTPAGEQAAAPPPPAPPAAEPPPPAPPAPAPAVHTITVKTDGLVASVMKMMGVSMGCGCAAVVAGILILILIIWLSA